MRRRRRTRALSRRLSRVRRKRIERSDDLHRWRLFGQSRPGGWAAILIYRDKRAELSGYEAHTTNNRMELMAAIRGLRALKEPCAVRLYSDSTYLVNAFEKKWLENWQKRNWLTAAKKPVEKSGPLAGTARPHRHTRGGMDQGARPCRQRRQQPLRRTGTRRNTPARGRGKAVGERDGARCRVGGMYWRNSDAKEKQTDVVDYRTSVCFAVVLRSFAHILSSGDSPSPSSRSLTLRAAMRRRSSAMAA